MSAVIFQVEPRSHAEKHGIRPGETLLELNGHEINDVLDNRFFETNSSLTVKLLSETGEVRQVEIHKPQYDALGLEFHTYLMGEQQHCKNKCIFCFIDQLPKGMRSSLYFKDDDSRLSFLFGNYITLTNLTDKDVDRILEMHISPVNISVHTTNPELRVKMMKNPFAGESLKYLYRLAEHGTKINCQLVLCPGYNDGEELWRSLRDLKGLAPAIESVAAVPVGLTKYRENLPHLERFTRESAGQVIDILEDFAAECRRDVGYRMAYASDEFYLLAGRPMPDAEFYGDMSQLENGVGMSALLEEEFSFAMEDAPGDARVRRVSLATGVAAEPLISRLCAQIPEKYPGVTCQVTAIVNHFFGEHITVSGLVTGGDLIAQMKGKDLGEAWLLPENMLRREGDLFLDDVSWQEVEKALGVPVVIVSNDGQALLDAILGD